MPLDAADPDAHKIRVISIYATQWRHTEILDEEAEEHLPLGHLEEFYAIYREQLPRILLNHEHDPATLAFELTEAEVAAGNLPPGTVINAVDDQVEATSVRTWLFVLPSDQVVAALDFQLRGAITPSTAQDPGRVDPLSTIRLLERCAYANVIIDGHALADHIAALAKECGARESVSANELEKPPVRGSGLRRLTARRGTATQPSAAQASGAEPFPPERHQIVFATQITGPPLRDDDSRDPGAGNGGAGTRARADDELIKRILYRVEPPNRPEFVEYKRPSGLNHTGTLCAVTPYVSLLSDHPEYVENSIFLTVVQAVGTAARFRQIWHKAHRRVRRFRRDGQDETVGTQSQDDLEILADELGNLELDLSFSVETSADLGLLIPSLRIESFHRALYAALELRERAETVSRMFSRLDATIRSELTAIQIRDKRNEDERRLRWAISLGVLSFVAIPISVLGAYFGVNGRQVSQDRSIFNMRYYGNVYLATIVFTLLPFITWLLLTWRSIRKQRARTTQSGENGTLTAVGTRVG